jgi:hypothetical protein
MQNGASRLPHVLMHTCYSKRLGDQEFIHGLIRVGEDQMRGCKQTCIFICTTAVQAVSFTIVSHNH